MYLVIVSQENRAENQIQQNLLLNDTSILSSPHSSLISPTSSSLTSANLSSLASVASSSSSSSSVGLAEMKAMMSTVMTTLPQSATQPSVSSLPSIALPSINMSQQGSATVLAPTISSIVMDNNCGGVNNYQQHHTQRQQQQQQQKNEIFRHLQHDWNFGGIKLTPSQLQHVVASPLQIPLQTQQTSTSGPLANVSGYNCLIGATNSGVASGSNAGRVVIKLDGCLTAAQISAMRAGNNGSTAFGSLTPTTASNNNNSIPLLHSESGLQNVSVEEVLIAEEEERDDDDDNDLEQQILDDNEEEDDNGNENVDEEGAVDEEEEEEDDNDDEEEEDGDEQENVCEEDNRDGLDGDSHLSDVANIKNIVDDLQRVPSTTNSSQQPQMINLQPSGQHVNQQISDPVSIRLPMQSLDGEFLQQQQQQQHLHHQPHQQQQSQQLVNMNIQSHLRDYIGEVNYYKNLFCM